MSSVLRSVAQPKSKFVIALADSVVGFVISDEDTAAPTVSTRTIGSLAIGTTFLDMGKTAVVLTGGSAASYRKLKLASAVYQGLADLSSNTIWIQDNLLTGAYDNSQLFARL